MITVTEVLVSAAAALFILQFILSEVRSWRSVRSYQELREAAIEEATGKVKRQYPFGQFPG